MHWKERLSCMIKYILTLSLETPVASQSDLSQCEHYVESECDQSAQWSHTWGVGLFGQNFLLLFFCFYNVPYICEG